MSFIFALAHFCENHGPVVVLATQPVAGAVRAEHLIAQPPPQTCGSCRLELPAEACNLTTTTADRTYVSTQYPPDAATYRRLQKVVHRALLAETTTGLRVFMFGDPQVGYLVVRRFRLRDPSARGSERQYALVVNTTPVTAGVMQHWEEVTAGLDALVEWMEERHGEEETRRRREEAARDQFSNERFLRRSGAVRARGLGELLGVEDVFARVHVWAVEVLQGVLQERAVVG